MSINIPEILVANCSGAIMILFLLLFRIRSSYINLIGERIYRSILIVTLLSTCCETISFLIDGKQFAGCYVLQYLVNSVSIEATMLVGGLWCLFVDFRIHRSLTRIKRKGFILGGISVAVFVCLILNLFIKNLVFEISADNEYSRGALNFAIYFLLFMFYIESIFEVHRSKRQGVSIEFFPVYYFVVPCLVGTAIQGCFYGIAVGWLSVVIALMFVHCQLQNFNTFVDEMSGLFNRKYMNYYLDKLQHAKLNDIYGIMIDANGFKKINDDYGHLKGDNAIHNIGRILTKSISEKAIAMRMAGDEFVVIINGSKEDVTVVQSAIWDNVIDFNKTTSEPYKLSLAMGIAKFDGNNIEEFLTEMDKQMYEDKRKSK